MNSVPSLAYRFLYDNVMINHVTGFINSSRSVLQSSISPFVELEVINETKSLSMNTYMHIYCIYLVVMFSSTNNFLTFK